MAIPFLIVGMPRTGSSLLLTSLKQHPNILPYGELFHKLESERKNTHYILYKNEKIYYPGGDTDAIEFLLEYVWNSENMNKFKAVGFKLFGERVQCVGAEGLFQRLKEEIKGLHIIHIFRENYLDVFISRKKAELTKIWIIPANKDIPLPKLEPIYVNPEVVKNFFNSMREVDHFFENFFKDCRYMKISYNDLSFKYQETMRKCFEFLGVNPIECVLPLKKLNIQSHRELIKNYDELVEYFRGLEYEKFFNVEKNSVVISHKQKGLKLNINNGDIPRIDFDKRLDSANIFADMFGNLDTNEWLEILIRSIEERIIDGVEFPSFPPPELQNRMHGSHGALALKEAAKFYSFVCNLGLTGPKAPWFKTGYMLDFGAGWGRIARLFLRDFPLKHIFGYEPSNLFCSIARACNPFVNFLSGPCYPDGILPNERFDLVVSWSVFSHLSQKAAEAWLCELERVTRSGGAIVLTTRGKRFLCRLQEEAKLLFAGQKIMWYLEMCIKRAGDLTKLIESYDKGEFVWFKGSTGAYEDYGEAIISRPAMESLIKSVAPRLEITVYDTTSLPQDVFVLRKKDIK